MRIIKFLLWTLLLPSICFGTDFYIDPVSGLDSNSGSSLSPWKSLQYLVDNGMIESREWDNLPYTPSSILVPKNSGGPIKAGDRLILRSGNYGELSIISFYNITPITIKAELGNTPVFRNIQLRSSSNWRIEGVTIDPSAFGDDSFSNMISLETHGWTGPVHNVVVKGCTLHSTTDSSGWSRDDWNSKAKNGIRVDGSHMTISTNFLKNVNFGITVGASHSMIDHNTIVNFAGDGLRGLGDYTSFQYNTIKNCYDVNGNHDDGFQSWSVGDDGKVGTGVVTGIVLRGNTIINYEDQNQPFKGTLQGIGCFDGMFKDWVVEKNRIIVDHWHGISLYGAINVVVRDNVVTDPATDIRPGPPWILLNSHKNGTPSRDSLVTCNIAPSIITSGGINIDERYNTLSQTGSPRHAKCPLLSNIFLLMPLLLERDD